MKTPVNPDNYARKQWLRSKPHLVGPFLRIPRPEIVELMDMAGFDFAVIDLEHGGLISIQDVYPMLLAAQGRTIRLLARVPALNESYFKALLDMNVGGLQVPHIKSADDAHRAVQYSRFSPEGERGLCRFVRAARFSNIPREVYVKDANRDAVLVLQIEGSEGLDNLESIIDVEGFDVLFIGPYDLSQSLGVIGQIWHEKVVEKIEHAVKVCSKRGIAVGVFTDTPEGARHWITRGVQYINYRIDVEMFLSSLKDLRSEIEPEQ